MKNKLIRLTIAMIVAMPSLSIAQSGDILAKTFVWNSAKGIDLVSGDTLNATMNFKTFAVDRIEHAVEGSQHTQTFDIVSTEGSWLNISQPGNIKYNVTINGQTGSIIIERTPTLISLTVDMSATANGGVKIKYLISSIQ